MLHIYIGDGKGKTTAALGLALRAGGWEKKIYFAQFLKGVNYPSGEIKAIKKYKLNIKIERFSNQIHPIFLKEKEVNIKKTKESTAKNLSDIESLIAKKKFDIFILDEILNALSAGFLAKPRLLKIIEKAKGVELVLTGRTAPADLIQLADYVSLVKKIKHPFDKKIVARKGIEY